jgi:glycosyltransferase involved in cell wall biosynthesis
MQNNKVVISINPDLADNFGHFLHYDQILHDDLKAKGISFFSLANKKSAFELSKHKRFVLPTFSTNTWEIGLSGKLVRKFLSTRRFKRELCDGIDLIIRTTHPDHEKIFYFYTGSLYHAKIISVIVAKNKYPGTKFIINLFWDHLNINSIKNRANYFRKITNKIDNNDKVHLFVDTEELNSKLKEILGVSFNKWPVFSVTPFLKKDLDVSNNNDNKEKISLLFPGNMRIEKGFDLIVSLVSKMSSEGYLDKFKIIMRDVVVFNTIEKVKKLKKKIDSRVEIVKGVLTEYGFIQLLNKGDIIILPYTVSEFATRTSGLFVDSVFLGKPVIAVKETWLGNRIEELNNGVTFKDGDMNDLLNAIENVSNNYPFYLNNCSKAKEVWLKNNNRQQMVDLLIN